MKISCNKNELSEAVSVVQRAVSSKTTIPALEGILIKAYNNQITVSGYDLELGMTTSIEANVATEGEIVVNAGLFYDIVRKMPNEIIKIETDDRLIMYISSGQADYQIIGISAKEYPEIPTFEQEDKIKIKAGILKNMIRQTIFAVSTNLAKPIYTGSLFEIEKKSIRIVSVDGYRMALRREQIDSDVSSKFVVPAKTQHEIIKFNIDDEKEIELIIGKRHISFQIDGYNVVSRLIEGTYLDYEATIPKNCKTHLTVKTKSLIESVDRMALLAGDKIQSPVRCKIGDDQINLSCNTSVGRAKDVLNVNISGEPVEIGFNYRYLLDALKNSDTDEVELELSGALSPMNIKPVSGDAFLFLVVPMRLSDEN
ncbi:MAG: DNA polymerase III subunit beta [Bacillota bacterium]|nr:DNA polymerase III subunit beta [Bacillota bacterium]